MSSSSKAKVEGGGINRDEPQATTNMTEDGNGLYEDEDQDEDGNVDFNPFLNEVPSPEASSSLSSEIECLDLHVDSYENTVESVAIDSAMLIDGVQESAIDDSERGEDEFLMQASDFPRGVFRTEPQNYMSVNAVKRGSILFSDPENGTVQVHENGAGSDTDVNDEDSARNSRSMTHNKNPQLDFDNEDAICKRTRARYSLASFTLDELETFLQETDDEDDIQNVDDEEEYRKFLASVLLGGDSDGHADQESVIVDDVDEDNDADFEIEIEEALESDLDENTVDKTQNDEYEEASRRPETRQTKRQKRASRNNLKKFSQQIDRSLRPLVPIMPNAPFLPFHTSDMRSLMPKASQCLASPVVGVSASGFTPHQIGQLHCLIHEHVQLLIQVFSISVLDPTRQHIASQVQGLISDMLSKRDQALAWRNWAYPENWFSRLFLQPMVPAELHTGFPTQSIFESSVTPDPQRDLMSFEQPCLHGISHCERSNEYVSIEQSVFPQTIDGFPWTPFIGGPLLSILDVAPLNLVERYMDDVKIAVHEYRRRLLEDTCDRSVDREPMFPLPSFPTCARTSDEVSVTSTPTVDALPSSTPGRKQPKKTLAATLVESSMKQSVALVPKVIVKLSQRFFQLFNPTLFPRKPPPPPVANRVLFTDAEDELLALGLMEYNSDWKAIQQRFLPCKSKHQIFVRQKNRSSSKASENPIKAVKRLKNSPLTADEIARIQEGLRIFKLDWMSIWKFMVPHRDPSLLPRQWRIALGTQKSYKIDPAKKERRRLYETKRRINISNLPNWKALSGREDDGTEILGQNGENSTYNEDEAYVHEAFLADWRLGASKSLSREGTDVREQLTENNSGKEFPYAPMNSGHPYAASNFTHAGYGSSLTGIPNPSILGSSKPLIYMRPYRARRSFNPHLVKLAPELPPVNLPSSARVMSQSARKSYHCEHSAEVSIYGGGVAKPGTTHLLEVRRTRTNSLEKSTQEFRVIRNTCVTGERGTEADLHMHPLLFKTAPNDGHVPYYPRKCGPTSSSPFSFSTRNHPKVSPSLLHNLHQTDPASNHLKEYSKLKETNFSSPGVDFHPLLQRTGDMNGELVGACSNEYLSVDLESFKGKLAHPQNCYDANHSELRNNGDPSTTSTKCYNLNHNKNARNLDLEIHLSFTSDMATTGSNLVSKVRELVAPSNDISRGSMDDVGEPSLQEIVMEHEELSDSDSDEQIEGRVEFECEEIADSEEEEGSVCHSRTKETPNYTVEKVSKIASEDQQWEPSAQGNYARKSSWLSLDSSVPGPS